MALAGGGGGTRGDASNLVCSERLYAAWLVRVFGLANGIHVSRGRYKNSMHRSFPRRRWPAPPHQGWMLRRASGVVTAEVHHQVRRSLGVDADLAVLGGRGDREVRNRRSRVE